MELIMNTRAKTVVNKMLNYKELVFKKKISIYTLVKECCSNHSVFLQGTYSIQIYVYKR